jgi:hypothetical protein
LEDEMAKIDAIKIKLFNELLDAAKKAAKKDISLSELERVVAKVEETLKGE